MPGWYSIPAYAVLQREEKHKLISIHAQGDPPWWHCWPISSQTIEVNFEHFEGSFLKLGVSEAQGSLFPKSMGSTLQWIQYYKNNI